MANRHSDPKVKEWMKGHKEEVEKVQERYDELKATSTKRLLDLAFELDVDTGKVREKLITGIIVAESKGK